MKLKDKLTAKIPEQKRVKVKKTLNVLRVIKNCFEEAVRLKEENDYTI